MNFLDELLRPVRPLYNNPKNPGKKPTYPKDRNGERFCPLCPAGQNWKPHAAFHKQSSDHSSGYQRSCIACKKEQLIRVRAARGKR
jgi:hypothetical protein